MAAPGSLWRSPCSCYSDSNSCQGRQSRRQYGSSGMNAKETDLSKTRMFVRKTRTGCDGNRRGRASDREDLPEAPIQSQQDVSHRGSELLTRRSLKLLFVSIPVYIT